MAKTQPDWPFRVEWAELRQHTATTPRVLHYGQVMTMPFRWLFVGFVREIYVPKYHYHIKEYNNEHTLRWHIPIR